MSLIPKRSKAYFLIVIAIICLISACNSINTKLEKPNIIIIYIDDLGYGDVSAYGAVSGLTPNVDKLSNNGLLFTDAHSPAATCTPSRYSLLTGRYAFRNNAKVLPGDAPLLIPTTTQTLPGMLKNAGYTTGIVGKWHLGLGNGDINWNEAIKPGPLEVGFDYSFIIPATGDRVPSVFVENHHVVNLDKKDPIEVSYKKPIDNSATGTSHPHLLKQSADSQHSDTITNGISRIGYMSGGHSARWVDEDFPDIFTDKVRTFIKKNKKNPFFLFYSFHDIHVPRVANKDFTGKTDMGLRGDVIAQMDWMTGQLMQILKDNNLDRNSLVIFTSDNGPVLDDGYGDEAVERVGKHKPAGQFRGGKYSAYEAGTRVPTIVHWPAKIKRGVSNALISQVDLFASLARLVNVELADTDAPDSFDLLDTWLGKSNTGRNSLVEESYTLSLREGQWKYIKPASNKRFDWIKNNKDIESGLLQDDQLFDLTKDVAEQYNLAGNHPEIVKQLKNRLIQIVESSGTRPDFKSID